MTYVSIFPAVGYHVSLSDNVTQDENASLDDFHFQGVMSEDAKISKRRLDSASDTFSKLGTFFKLAKAPAPKKRKSSGWFWSRRRRRTPVPGNFNFFKFIPLYSPIGIYFCQLTKTHEMDFDQNRSRRLKWTIILP